MAGRPGSGSILEELARSLAEPIPRRRALRLLGVSLVAVAVPGMRPGRAGATRGRALCTADQQQCHNTFLTQQWCCELRKYIICGEKDGQCIDTCTGKGATPCGAGKSFDCCFDPLGKPGLIECKKGKCVPTCKGVGLPGGDCGDTCCTPQQDCVGGKCLGKCPPGRPRCGTKCCDKGYACKQGKCCPGTKVCGRTCCQPPNTCKKGVCTCPSGRKSCNGKDCCGKNESCASCGTGSDLCCKSKETCVVSKGRNTCCPDGQVTKTFGMTACCPPNTYPQLFGCCNIGLRSCCTGDIGKKCAAAGKLCVNGQCVRP
jgi:hypothetical protein